MALRSAACSAKLGIEVGAALGRMLGMLGIDDGSIVGSMLVDGASLRAPEGTAVGAPLGLMLSSVSIDDGATARPHARQVWRTRWRSARPACSASSASR